jgi:hypothetical protein
MTPRGVRITQASVNEASTMALAADNSRRPKQIHLIASFRPFLFRHLLS